MKMEEGRCSNSFVRISCNVVRLRTLLICTRAGDMLSQEELPEGLLSKCLDVLRELSNNERDLIRVVVEIVHDLRDFGDEEETEEDPDVSRPVCIFSILT